MVTLVSRIADVPSIVSTGDRPELKATHRIIDLIATQAMTAPTSPLATPTKTDLLPKETQVKAMAEAAASTIPNRATTLSIAAPTPKTTTPKTIPMRLSRRMGKPFSADNLRPTCSGPSYMR